METTQLISFENQTPEQAEACALHYEIIGAAQLAANSLLDLGRKLKRMRDTGYYRVLGFESFGDYTEQAAGIRQRQAYNYITVVEKLPAKLIEENAAAGITKLALLARLGPGDREEAAAGLAEITVADLQKLIDEKNGLAQQLSILQDTPSAPAVEIDLEAERRAAAEAARAEALAEAGRQHERQMRDAAAAHKKELAEVREQAVVTADQLAKAHIKKAEDKAAKQAKKERAEAEERLREEVEKARAEGAERAEKEANWEIAQARTEAANATAKAEALQRQLETANSRESTELSVLFDQLQDVLGRMEGALDVLRGKDAATADRMRAALGRALDEVKKRVCAR